LPAPFERRKKMQRYHSFEIYPAEHGDYYLRSDHKQVMKERDKAWEKIRDNLIEQIATLREELRLSGLRGDSLDRVVAGCVEKELTMKADLERIERDKAILEGARSGLRADNAWQAEEIAVLKADISDLNASRDDVIQRNARQVAEIEKLKRREQELKHRLYNHGDIAFIVTATLKRKERTEKKTRR